jgi:hypothetical protein
MTWLHLVSYFFGGIFLANAIPHFVSGIMGRPFQSPFAKPPGEGLSSSTVNVLWGFFNAVAGYFLVVRVGNFDLRSISDVLALAAGALVISVLGISASFMEAIPRNVHEQSSGGCFPRFEHLQFSCVVSGRAGFQHRYMDATCRSGLAGPYATHPS